MFDPTQAGLNTNGVRNGHGTPVQPSSVFVTWPPPSASASTPLPPVAVAAAVPSPPVAAAAGGTPPPAPDFPHITSKEEGLAAPGVLTDIPDHPTLGGALYASGPLARDSRYLLGVLERTVRKLEEQVFEIHASELILLLENARACTQRLRETDHEFYKQLRHRQKTAQEARSLFLERAASIRAAMEAATSTLRADLGDVDMKIAQAQRLAMMAHCRPGVPRAIRQGRDSATTATTEVDSARTPKLAASPGIYPAWVRVGFKGITGSLVGVMFGLDWHFFSLRKLTEFEPSTRLWMGLWMLGGVAFVGALAEGLHQWWRKTGERCTGEPPDSSLVPVRVLRHTLFPLATTAFTLLVEASIMRNVKVASPLVRDPGNWMYLLGSLGFIFSVTLGSAIGGWVEGCNARERALTMERAETAQANQYKHREATIVQSARAQTAFSLDDYVQTLQERRRRQQADLDAVEAPYLSLLTQYSAETSVPTMLADAELRTLRKLELDAEAAYAKFHNKLGEYGERLEQLPGLPVSARFTLCFVRDANGDLVPPAPPPSKLSWRQRLRAFLGRVGKRVTRRKRKQEDPSEQTA